MFYDSPKASTLDRLIQLPWLLLTSVALLAGIGCATLYSVAGGSLDPWAGRHGLRFLAAILLAIVLALVPAKVWRTLAGTIYILALGLLAAVPLIGVDALGARRVAQYRGVSPSSRSRS
ncbi:MAG: hypothetical protein HC841_08940 [Verrucomicrobiae bacterium]|nr:hypothetical protein [Verrucomicrobiae bacterium]